VREHLTQQEPRRVAEHALDRATACWSRSNTVTSRSSPVEVTARYRRLSGLVSQIRDIDATGASTGPMAAAICWADGRSDTEPTANRRPDPMQEPMSRVMRAASAVV
jgi:hypothetical protein